MTEEETWRTEEHEECWTKRWLRYDHEGKAKGAVIIVKNGSQSLIEEIKDAWKRTEGQLLK